MPAVTERAVSLTGHDQYLFREGTHSRLYEKLGAHFLDLRRLLFELSCQDIYPFLLLRNR